MVITIAMAALGSMFSEKPVVNGICLCLSFLTGLGVILLWMKLATAFEDAANDELYKDDDFDIFGSMRAQIEGTAVPDTRFKSGLGFSFLCAGVAGASMRAYSGAASKRTVRS